MAAADGSRLAAAKLERRIWAIVARRAPPTHCASTAAPGALGSLRNTPPAAAAKPGAPEPRADRSPWARSARPSAPVTARPAPLQPAAMGRRHLLAAAALLSFAQLALSAASGRALAADSDAACIYLDKCVPSPAAVVAGKAPANDHDRCAAAGMAAPGAPACRPARRLARCQHRPLHWYMRCARRCLFRRAEPPRGPAVARWRCERAGPPHRPEPRADRPAHRRVYAKIAAYAYACSQNADAAACAADTANFCAYNADRKAAPCDVDHNKALATDKCAETLNADANSVYSSGCQAYWFLADYCANLPAAACADNTLCAAAAGKCATPATLGSSSLLAYAAEAGTPLASDIQGALVRCGKAASAADCAAAAPAVAPDAAVVTALKDLALKEVAGGQSVALNIGNSSINLGELPGVPG